MDMRKTEIDKVNRQSRCVDYINERNIDDSTLKRIHQDGNMQNTKQCTCTYISFKSVSVTESSAIRCARFRENT